MIESRRAVAFLMAIAALGAASCSTEGGNDAPQTITAAELAERLAAGSPPLILDVRTEGEYASGHIPGAINIPHDALASRLPELPADRDLEIVVHCKSGRRAQLAENVLAEAGYTHVLDLEGHMQEWQRAGLATE